MCGKSFKFLDDTVCQICHCLDNHMKELSREGHVQPHNQANVITVKQKNDMSSCHILKCLTPKQLQVPDYIAHREWY